MPNKFRSEDRVRLRHILLALPKTATPDEVQAVTEKAWIYTSDLLPERISRVGSGILRGAAGRWWRYRLDQPRHAISGIEQVAFEKLSVAR